MINTIEEYSEINNLINKDLVMVIAKSHTCSSCTTIANIMENNMNHFDKIDKYNVYVDDMDQFRGEYLIFSVPTVIIFSEGKELLRQSRYFDYEKIDRLIEMFTN